MSKGYVTLSGLQQDDGLMFVSQYLNEFSKALATEVRMLLGEVGKLREDRRALQQ